MSHAACHLNVGKYLLGAVLLTLLIAVPQALAAEDITGEWEVTAESPWGPMQHTLTFEKKPDGPLTAKWGARALSNVKFESDQLTFTRTIPTPDGDMTQNFKGTVKDGKLTGVASAEQGDSSVTGAKRKPMSPAVGVWDLKYKVGDQDVATKLTIAQKPDGVLDAKWASPLGDSVVSNVKFQDGKLTLDRKSKAGDREVDTPFAGMIQGDKLTGAIKSDVGDIAVTGTRFGTELIGKWEMTSVSDMGTWISLMIINPDLSGRYEIFSEIPMKDVKFENGQLTFAVQFGPEDQPMRMDFKGKLEGKTVKGQMTSEMNTSEITGKKAEPAVPAGADAPAKAAAPAGSPPAEKKAQ